MADERFRPWGDVSDLLRLIDVEPVDEDRWRAPPSPGSQRGVVDGQQILAATVVAAGKAEPSKRVANAHAVFCRIASVDVPLDFVVRRVHSGRTFATLSIEARQGDRVCAAALVLLDNAADDMITSSLRPPEIGGPDDATPIDMGITGRDLRIVDDTYSPDPELIGSPEIHAWMRYDRVGDRADLHRGLIAQLSGHFHVAAAMRPHAGVGEAQAHRTLSTGNLAITITFHRDASPGEWLLFTNRNTNAGRGLTFGTSEVFTQLGTHVASFSVQAMVRAFEPHARDSGRDEATTM